MGLTISLRVGEGIPIVYPDGRELWFEINKVDVYSGQASYEIYSTSENYRGAKGIIDNREVTEIGGGLSARVGWKIRPNSAQINFQVDNGSIRFGHRDTMEGWRQESELAEMAVN